MKGGKMAHRVLSSHLLLRCKSRSKATQIRSRAMEHVTMDRDIYSLKNTRALRTGNLSPLPELTPGTRHRLIYQRNVDRWVCDVCGYVLGESRAAFLGACPPKRKIKRPELPLAVSKRKNQEPIRKAKPNEYLFDL